MRLAILYLHFIAVALGAGLSFSNLINLYLASGVQGDAAKGLALQRRTVARIGDVVIALIWLTGLGLAWSGGLRPEGVFAWKIAVVIILTLCHIVARYAASVQAIKWVRVSVAGVFLSALTAFLLAVLAFET
jgi:hypothetical protein